MLLALLACTPSITTPGDSTAPGSQWIVEPGETEGVDGPEQLDVFSDTEIHAFAIELDAGSRSDLRNDPTDYTDGVFIAGGVRYEIGLRIKGTSTYDDIGDKPSLKLDFSYTHDEQRFFGMRRVNLHNIQLDPFKSSEVLMWGLFREADLPAPRVGYTTLEIDDDERGLYTIVEDIEDDFLKRWFDDGDGNLYENAENYCDLDSVSCFEADEFDEGNHDALQGLINASDKSGANWLGEMQTRMDWDRFVRFLAMERTIAHWDSYSFDLSNYRLYHEPTLDSFTFIPWSGDLGFGYRPWSYTECGRHGVDPKDYDMGKLAKTCERVEECEEAVQEAMLEFASMLEEVDAAGQVVATMDRVRDAAFDDPTTNESHFEEHGACVESFLRERPEVIRDWVESR